MLLRIAIALFFSTLAVFATAERLGVGVPISLEEAINRSMAERATPEALARYATEALDRDDVEEARSFADLGQQLGKPLPPDLIARLETEEGLARTSIRNTGRFLSGLVTGEGDGAAGLAGSVISDFTVVGDLRDVASEGSKFVAGEPYSRFLLGLSAVGIAATIATGPSFGALAPVRLSMSLFKFAWKSGDITAGFARSLGAMLTRAVDFGRIGDIARTMDFTSPTALRRAAVEIGENVRPQVLENVAGDLVAVERTVGAATTTRLLRFVRSTDDLAEVPAFAARFGGASLAVAKITGRASLRVFKTTIRVAQFLLESIVAVLAWFGGLLLTMVWGVARRGLVGLVDLTSHRRATSP